MSVGNNDEAPETGARSRILLTREDPIRTERPYTLATLILPARDKRQLFKLFNYQIGGRAFDSRLFR